MESLKNLSNLTGSVAIITGGGGHIGRAIAESLAELGSNLVLVDINSESMEKLSAELSQKFGIECEVQALDLSNEGMLRELPDKIIKRFGRIDILVNNAAYVGTSKLQGWMVPFEEQSIETWRAALEVNLTAPFILTQICAKHLIESKNGSVINIGSIRGMVGVDLRLYENTKMNSSAAYSASKGGLLQITRYLATVMAPHVRVNSISLGGIFRNQEQAFVDRYVSSTPLRRMGTEEDIKGAIAFLASNLSAYVTGHNLAVDGGWVAW